MLFEMCVQLMLEAVVAVTSLARNIQLELSHRTGNWKSPGFREER